MSTKPLSAFEFVFADKFDVADKQNAVPMHLCLFPFKLKWQITINCGEKKKHQKHKEVCNRKETTEKKQQL